MDEKLIEDSIITLCVIAVVAIPMSQAAIGLLYLFSPKKNHDFHTGPVHRED
jgi:hypothetical protein